MIKIKCRYDDSVRITIITPSLGDKGDMTDRSFAGDCDVDAILRKYGTQCYTRFTSADCADVSELPADRLEMEVMMENVRAAHKEYGGDMDINDWVASLFKKKEDDSKPADPKPADPKPADPKPDEPKEGE